MADELIARATHRDEAVPADEAAAIAAIVERLVTQVREDAQTGPARRDAHPKAHGCVTARFRVLDDLPDSLRAGLFATPRSYDSLIRLSNGSPKPQPDSAADVRGMAIKVLGVAASPSGTQDFVMINGSRFFVRTAVDYVSFATADPRWRFFAPSWNPLALRLREATTLLRLVTSRISNPLDPQYWSTLPFLYGETVCKFSASPHGPPSRFSDRTGSDFLKNNLRRHLAGDGCSFDFMVQLRTRPETMSIEDSTIEWPSRDAPFTAVASITIPPQDVAANDALGETLSFTPWHGLPAHRPLGGINRTRRTAYETISTLRHELNGTVREEPPPVA